MVALSRTIKVENKKSIPKNKITKRLVTAVFKLRQ